MAQPLWHYQSIEKDKHIKKILDLGRQANIAVFTVGTVKNDALLFRLGYIDKKDRDIIQNRAVGDICSRFIDAQVSWVSLLVTPKQLVRR